MSSIPPFSEVYDAFLHAVVPAFGTTVFVAGMTSWIFGRRAGYLAAAVAFATGIVIANLFRGCFVLRFDPESTTSPFDVIRGLWSVLIGARLSTDRTAADSFFAPPAGRYWLPWAALLATGGGLLTHHVPVPAAVKQILRFFISMITAKMVVPAALANGSPWVIGLVGLNIFLIWMLAEWRTARFTNLATPAAAGLASMGAAAVLLHAHSARLTDIATLIAFASFGIAVAALVCPIAAEGAFPAIAVLLTGVLMTGYHETFSSIPAIAFIVPAMAPLATALLAIFPDRGLHGWRKETAAIALVGIPTVTAIVLASRAETLSF